MANIEVKATQEHLASMTRLKTPMDAIEELVWNAFDADATVVSISLSTDIADGLTSITVSDNGKGMPRSLGLQVFGNLGDSPKNGHKFTAEGRAQHGKEGKGRLKAFGLGSSVEWLTRYSVGEDLRQYAIKGTFGTLRRFEISDETPSDSNTSGTRVKISAIQKALRSLLEIDSAVADMGRRFALHMARYPELRIEYGGKLVDPSVLQDKSKSYPVTFIDENGEENELVLDVIEWKRQTDKKLYLCDSVGFTLDERSAVVPAPGFNYTAYLKGQICERYFAESAFASGDMRPEVARLIDTGKDQLRNHFREREHEHVGELVDIWRKEEIYPYVGNDQSPLKAAERQVFDVCATKVYEYLPGFTKTDAQNKRFTFRLIKESLENNPQALHLILKQVLSLPSEQQDDLAKILERTHLSAVLNAAKTVFDRLDFIAGLEELLFGEFKKELLEARQLQPMLADQLWIFGEQYSKGVDDQSLGELLRKHISILGRKALVEDEEPVVDFSGKSRRVDLMLFKQIPQMTENRFEHLVIELKRPRVVLGQDEISQIKNYAFTVQRDGRFDKATTKWTFILVGGELDEYAQQECNVDNREFGDIYKSSDSSLSIHVRKWSNIIAEAKWRHNFYRDKLEVVVEKTDGITFLRKRYPQYLPTVDEADVDQSSQ